MTAATVLRCSRICRLSNIVNYDQLYKKKGFGPERNIEGRILCLALSNGKRHTSVVLYGCMCMRWITICDWDYRV